MRTRELALLDKGALNAYLNGLNPEQLTLLYGRVVSANARMFRRFGTMLPNSRKYNDALRENERLKRLLATVETNVRARRSQLRLFEMPPARQGGRRWK